MEDVDRAEVQKAFRHGLAAAGVETVGDLDRTAADLGVRASDLMAEIEVSRDA
jgi:phosphohistidine phosphatase SixA